MSNPKAAWRSGTWRTTVVLGCLLAGMLTAWQGPTQAATIAPLYINVTIDTTQAVHETFITYGCGESDFAVQSLGSFPQGLSTYSVPIEHADYHPYYGIAGLYDHEDGSEGMVLSFPTDVTVPTSWEEIFPAMGVVYDGTEEDAIALIHEASANVVSARYALGEFLGYYTGWQSSPYALQFGEEALLIGFSNATLLGSIGAAVDDEPLPIVFGAPEPSSWALLVGAVGLAWVGRRKLRRG